MLKDEKKELETKIIEQASQKDQTKSGKPETKQLLTDIGEQEEN